MRILGRLLLWLAGWRAIGAPPAIPRFVLIAAPHTSNWDGYFLLAFAAYYGLDVRWLAKDTIFRGPLGWFFRALGGIPVDRSQRTDMVTRLAERIRAADRMILAIPPEGTRKYTETWKSGFYHIARAAGVPVVLSFLDFAKKEGGFGPTVELTGDVSADMDTIRAFYADKRGRFPELEGRIRLRDEDASPADAASPAGATAADSASTSTAPGPMGS